MQVRVKATVYAKAWGNKKLVKISAGTVGTLDDLVVTYENIPVAKIRFPQGMAELNPSIYEVIPEAQQDFPTAPGIPSIMRIPKEE